MTGTNHIPAPAANRVGHEASRAVATLALAIVAAIVVLVIIGVVAGFDLPAMEDFTSTTPPSIDPSTS